MARIPGINANFSFNTVSIEDELQDVELAVDVDLHEVSALADVAAEFVEGQYSSRFSLNGAADFVASQGDATIFGQIGSGEAAFVFQPTGAAAGASDPNYTGNGLVRRYSIRCGAKDAARYSAEIQVNGAVARAVA